MARVEPWDRAPENWIAHVATSDGFMYGNHPECPEHLARGKGNAPTQTPAHTHTHTHHTHTHTHLDTWPSPNKHAARFRDHLSHWISSVSWNAFNSYPECKSDDATNFNDGHTAIERRCQKHITCVHMDVLETPSKVEIRRQCLPHCQT